MFVQSLRIIVPVFLIGLGYVGANWLFLAPPETEIRVAANQDPDTAGDGIRELVLKGDGFGGYTLSVTVNGRPADFVVNVRGPQTILRVGDARTFGVLPNQADFYENGREHRGKRVLEAEVTLAEVKFGPFTITDIPAVVDTTPRIISIIGTDLLQELGEYEVQGKNLVIRY